MDRLHQKRHGLPGVPFVSGKPGVDGTGGNNVYFGYINEFFDVIDVSVDSIVRAASTELGQHYTGVYDASGNLVSDVLPEGSRYMEISDDPEFPERFSASYQNDEKISREYTKADTAAIGKDASGNLNPWNVSLGSDRWKISDPSGLLDTHGHLWPGQPWNNSSVGPYIPFDGNLDTSLRMKPGRYSLSIADKNGFDLFSAISGQSVYQFALTPSTHFYDKPYDGFDDSSIHNIDNPSIGELQNDYASGGGIRLKTDFIKYAAAVNDNMQVPDKLKSDIKAGDVIYFYTDENNFQLTGKVEYMTVITESLEKCSYLELIDNAVMTEPFSFKFFDERANVQNGYLYSTLPAVTGFYNTENSDDIKDVSAYGRNMVKLLGCLGEDVTLHSGTISKKNSQEDNNMMLFVQNSGDTINSKMTFLQKPGDDSKIIIDTYSSKNAKTPMLKISRAYIKKNNIGNVETVSLANPDGYKTDKDGYIHMLDSNDYVASESTFYVKPSDYFYDLTSKWQLGVVCETYKQSLYYSDGRFVPLTAKQMKLNDNTVKNFNWSYEYSGETAFRLDMKYGNDTMHVITVWAELPGSLKKTSRSLKAQYSIEAGGFVLSELWPNSESSSDDSKITEPRFVVSSVSAESITDAPVDIIIPYENGQDVKVFINTTRITPLLNYSSIDAAGHGSWCVVTMKPFSDDDIKDGYLTIHLKMSMTSNLPSIGGSYDKTADYNASPGSNTATIANGCDVFNTLISGESISTEDRSLTISVNYTYSGVHHDGFTKVVQPGYKDLRKIPNVGVSIKKDIRSLEDANRSDMGVMSNEFQFFVEVSIDDFNQSIWGSYVPEDDIRLNMEIRNMPVDYDFVEKYGIQRIQQTRTFHVNTVSDDDFNNNYIRLKTYVMDPSFSTYRGKTQSELDEYNKNAKFISAQDNIIDEEYGRVRITAEQFGTGDERQEGILDNIVVNISNVRFSDIKNGKFCFRVVAEIGNPIFSMLFFRFYVSNMWIDYKYTDSTGVYKTNKFYVGTNNLAVRQQIGSRETYDYMFASDTFNAFICPVSMTSIPKENDVDRVIYPSAQGDYNLSGDKQQISLKTALYVPSDIVKDNENLSDNEKTSKFVKEQSLGWFNFSAKKKYFQDDVTNIKLRPLSPEIIRSKISGDEAVFIESGLLDDIKSTKNDKEYLTVVYDSTTSVLLSKKREDMNTFIYNSDVFEADRFAQHQDKIVVSTRQIPVCQVRDASLENSITSWNKIYLDRTSLTDEIEGRFLGVISAYGNGYDFLSETSNDDFESYAKLKDILTLDETQKQSNEKISYVSIDEAKTTENLTQAPYKNQWFRTLLYQNQWQYPKYYTDDQTQIRKVDLYDIVPASDFVFGENNDMKVPHNIMYSIYPRCAYDTDNDMPIIFMLRSPSVVEENNYKMRYSDLRIMIDESRYEPIDHNGLNPAD